MADVVRKYKDVFKFLMYADYFYIEVVEPRTTWVFELPYEVSKEEVAIHITTIINISVDPNEPKFGIAKEIFTKMR